MPRDLTGAAPFWIAIVFLLAAGYAIGSRTGLLGRGQREIDTWASDLISGVRTSGGGEAGRWVDRLLPWGLLLVARWAIAIALVGFRRWRHLAMFVGSVALPGRGRGFETLSAHG